MQALQRMDNLKDCLQIRMDNEKIEIISLTFCFANKCSISISFRKNGDFIEISQENVDMDKSWISILNDLIALINSYLDN